MGGGGREVGGNYATMLLFCVESFIRGLAYFLIFIWILYFLNSMNSNFYDMRFILHYSTGILKNILKIYW